MILAIFFFQEIILKMLWGVRDISLEMIFLGLGLSSWVNNIGTDRKKRTIEDEFMEVGGRAENDIGQTKNVCISEKNNDSVILIKSNPGLSAMAKKIHRIIIKPEKTHLIVLGK